MKNKALLVGINKYPDPRNELRGCINDIKDMIHFISEANNVYQKENIIILTNSLATKKAIVEKLKWLVKDAQAGDQLLFHYSGHGAQAPTKNHKEEADGYDEIICPYDFDWSSDTTLKDKEFAEIFQHIPKGVHFIWISDSCHAEDLSRDPMNANNTSYRFFNGQNTFPLQTGPSATAANLKILNGVLLSACQSHQLSADAYIENRFNGAFTHYLLKNLANNGFNKNLQEIVAKVHADLSKNGFDQIPEFEGQLTKSSFFL
jgi:hypothetical protein